MTTIPKRLRDLSKTFSFRSDPSTTTIRGGMLASLRRTMSRSIPGPDSQQQHLPVAPKPINLSCKIYGLEAVNIVKGNAMFSASKAHFIRISSDPPTLFQTIFHKAIRTKVVRGIKWDDDILVKLRSGDEARISATCHIIFSLWCCESIRLGSAQEQVLLGSCVFPLADVIQASKRENTVFSFKDTPLLLNGVIHGKLKGNMQLIVKDHLLLPRGSSVMFALSGRLPSVQIRSRSNSRNRRPADRNEKNSDNANNNNKNLVILSTYVPSFIEKKATGSPNTVKMIIRTSSYQCTINSIVI
eukprot:gene437-784_t